MSDRARRARRSGPTEPIAIGDAVERVSADLGSAPLDLVTHAGAALGEWLGDDRDRVVLRSFIDGELVVEAADARFAADLGYRRDELREVLAACLPTGALRRVRVVVKRR